MQQEGSRRGEMRKRKVQGGTKEEVIRAQREPDERADS